MYNSVQTAQKIKDICRAKGITSVQLSQKIGSNRNIFNKIASEKILDIRYFVDIAQFLGVKLDDIVVYDQFEV